MPAPLPDDGIPAEAACEVTPESNDEKSDRSQKEGWSSTLAINECTRNAMKTIDNMPDFLAHALCSRTLND
jgi:hypothetical protein